MPRRPRRAAVLAADRRRQEPPGGRPAVVHDDVRPRQHLHQPPVAARSLRSSPRRRSAALGDWQGSRLDDFRDEDPGRILHEMRYGEMAALRGAAALAVLRVRRRDPALRGPARRVRALDRRSAARPGARARSPAALDWIDQYADLMGNGYISYKRRNEQTGLENQCWKDSWNSISYRDGRLPDFPRATCELQGYAYDAKMRGARLARLVWKDPAYADQPRAPGGRPEATLQRRLLGRRRRLLRPRPRCRRQPGRCARVEHRPPAVERHRRDLEGESNRAGT